MYLEPFGAALSFVFNLCMLCCASLNSFLLYAPPSDGSFWSPLLPTLIQDAGEIE